MKKYAMPIMMLVVFETIAIILWLTKDDLFYYATGKSASPAGNANVFTR